MATDPLAWLSLSWTIAFSRLELSIFLTLLNCASKKLTASLLQTARQGALPFLSFTSHVLHTYSFPSNDLTSVYNPSTNKYVTFSFLVINNRSFIQTAIANYTSKISTIQYFSFECVYLFDNIKIHRPDLAKTSFFCVYVFLFYCVCVKRKKLCNCHSNFCFLFFLLVTFSGQTGKIYFQSFPNCCFERVWPASKLIIWYAVYFQPMSFRDIQ